MKSGNTHGFIVRLCLSAHKFFGLKLREGNVPFVHIFEGNALLIYLVLALSGSQFTVDIYTFDGLTQPTNRIESKFRVLEKYRFAVRGN